MTPEEARDQAMEEIIAAGGSIISTIPMALPDSPHVISAYEINAGASDIEGLIPYTPEEVPYEGFDS